MQNNTPEQIKLIAEKIIQSTQRNGKALPVLGIDLDKAGIKQGSTKSNLVKKETKPASKCGCRRT